MPTIAPPRTAPPLRKTNPTVHEDNGLGNGLGWDSQVILFNDDVHTFEYVVAMLCSVFGHSVQLAEKIMLEAHTKGRAIAEVEERKKAEEHAASLRSGGLRATVENIG